MGTKNKVTNYLKILRNTQVSPSLCIPQGVQVLLPGLFGKSCASVRSPRLSRLLVFALAPTFIFALFGLSISSQTAYAASYINVSSGSGGTVSLGSIKPSSTGVSASGSDTLTITTNCSAGYSVYVSGQEGGDTNLTNTDKTITSSNIISASSTAVGSTATTLNSNTWGITGDSSNASASKYVGLPSYANATNKALISNSSADNSGDNKNTVYYGVKVDTSLIPGTYSGDVLYTVLMDDTCLAYLVNYNANAPASEISGAMSPQSIMYGSTEKLAANSFTRPGYVFLGWSKTANGKTGTATNGIGTMADVDFKDEEEVNSIAAPDSTIDLYAIWLKADGFMQDWAGCATLTGNNITTLADKRDGATYRIKKLPDGKCWMIDYLTLGSKGSVTLTPDDTNIDNSITYYLPKAGTMGEVDGITDPATLTASTTASFVADNSKRPMVQFRYKDSSILNDSDIAYYNPYTFSLGYFYDGYTSSPNNSSRDICPKGWRAPFAENQNGSVINPNTNNDVTILARSYNPDATWVSSIGITYFQTSDAAIMRGLYTGLASAENNYAGFALAGSWNGTTNTWKGSWASLRVNGTYSKTQGFYLRSDGTMVQPNYWQDSTLYSGGAVRCIAKNDYVISYDMNSANSGNPSKIAEGAYNGGAVTMPSQNTLTKQDYYFRGWALANNATTATYTENQSVPLTDLLAAASAAGQTTTNGSVIALYAVWERITMQNWVGCPDLAPNNIITLPDTRDGAEYRIKKLPDGRCWMIDYLTLGSKGSVTLTPNDTNIDNGVTYYLPKAGYMGTADGITNPSTLTSTTVAAFNSTTGKTPTIQFRVKTASLLNDSDQSYYNMYTATLGYLYQGVETTGAYSTRDICPKGWRLPRASSSNQVLTNVDIDNDLTILARAYNPAAAWSSRTGVVFDTTYDSAILTGLYKGTQSADNNYAGFSLNGNWISSGHAYEGTWGSMLVNSAYSSTLNYYMRYNSSYFQPNYYPDGGYLGGMAVRCIKQEDRTISDLTNMQDMNAAICGNSAIGENKVLTDTRDKETYRVNKLKDGKCWMVENIRISDIELNSTTSNLATGTTFTVPASTPNEPFTASNAGTTARMALSTDATNARAYGGYYNYVAATAGSGSGYNVGATSGTYSIYPKGWTLPTKDQFVNLDKAFGYSGENRTNSTSIWTYDPNVTAQISNSYTNSNYSDGYPGFVIAGRYWQNNTTLYSTERAIYWSSTADSSNSSNAYYMAFGYVPNSYNYIYPPYSDLKYCGSSVRCIAR